MEKLTRDAGERTPQVLLDPDKGLMEIAGRSLPENSVAFYQPIAQWISDYSAINSKKAIEAKILLEYFNTSSSKCILDILRQLGKLAHQGWKINVKWLYYDDEEDMISSGLEYQGLVDYNIELERYNAKSLIISNPLNRS